jgi:hypothetical protein
MIRTYADATVPVRRPEREAALLPSPDVPRPAPVFPLGYTVSRWLMHVGKLGKAVP